VKSTFEIYTRPEQALGALVSTIQWDHYAVNVKIIIAVSLNKARPNIEPMSGNLYQSY